MHLLGFRVSSIRKSHRDIHDTGEGKDKNRVEESEEVSLGD